METAELLRSDVYGFICPASLDLLGDQRAEKIQNWASVRRIMDISQLKSCRKVQIEASSVPLWICQASRGPKRSRSERLSGELWTFIEEMTSTDPIFRWMTA